jgi:hypothetical protein
MIMSTILLSSFMHLALQKTRAERALVADNELAIVDMINLEQADIMSDSFLGIETIRQALDSGEPIVTNNAVTSVSNAPLTNTNFSNLRVVVVIPVADYGAVYLDQPIRNGIIPKDTIDRLMAVSQHVAQNGQVDLNEAELGELYQQIG